MRLIRPAVALATLACLAGGVTANAASTSCNLVKDDANDATGFLVLASSPAPSNANLDILSGDIATNDKTITAVIRTSAIGKDSTSMSDYYYFNFTANGSNYFLAGRYDGTTASFSVGDFSGTGGTRHTIGAATGTVDAAKKEVRISTPRSVLGLSTKAVYSDLNVLAQRYFGTAQTGGVTPTADDATSDKTYKAGTKSCVKVGF